MIADAVMLLHRGSARIWGLSYRVTTHDDARIPFRNVFQGHRRERGGGVHTVECVDVLGYPSLIPISTIEYWAAVCSGLPAV